MLFRLVWILFLLSSSVFSQTFLDNNRGMGFVPDGYDYWLSIPSHVSHTKGVPPKVDFSSELPPTGDQGTQNSSSAFGISYTVRSYLEYRRHSLQGESWSYYKNKDIDYSHIFSPSFLYNSINKGNDKGIPIGEALFYTSKYGSVSWKDMPYNPANYILKPSNSLYTLAKANRNLVYKRMACNDVVSIKSALSQKIPVIAGVLVYENFMNLKNNEVYEKLSGKFRGAQTLVLSGYDDSNNYFIAQNSWSNKWGSNGLGKIDYSIFSKSCRQAYILLNPEEESLFPDSTPISNQIAAPTHLSASLGVFSNKVLVQWEAVKNAIGYEVYRSEPGEKNLELVAKVAEPFLEDTGVIAGVAYKYKVKAIGEFTNSNLTEELVSGYASDTPKSRELNVLTVTGVKASHGEYNDKIEVEWNPIQGVELYEVFKWNEKTKTYYSVAKVKSTMFLDTNVEKSCGTELYRIGAIVSGKSGLLSEAVIGYTSPEDKPEQPVGVEISEEVTGKVSIKWKPVKDAVNYAVFRFYDSKWEKVGSTNKEFFEDLNPPEGKVFYSITAMNKKGKWGSYSNTIPGFIASKRNSFVNMPSTKFTKVNLNKDTLEVSLEWESSKKAKSYSLWFKKYGDSKWSLLTSTEATNHKVFLPSKEDFYLYSITTVSKKGKESTNSNPIAVVHSIPKKSGYKYRTFGKNSRLEKFKGKWTAIQWDGKLSTRNIVLSIDSVDSSNSSYKINIDSVKSFEGKYVEDSPVIQIEDRIKIELAYTEDALMVELNDQDIIQKKEELSFLRE